MKGCKHAGCRGALGVGAKMFGLGGAVGVYRAPRATVV